MVRVFSQIKIRNEEILEQLQEHYPNVFTCSRDKLLKIGIHQDVRQEKKLEASRKELVRFFMWYCNRLNYRKLVVAGAKRYDLQGQEVAEITAEDVLNYQEYRKKIDTVIAEKRLARVKNSGLLVENLKNTESELKAKDELDQAG